MLYNLKELFKERIFRIPCYQRGYSWEKKHLEQLWNDIKNIPFPQTNSYHFTGTLTLNKFSTEDLKKLSQENHGYFITKENKVKIKDDYFKAFQLVDGQQRTTSLLILISIIIETILKEPDISQALEKEVLKSKNNYLVLYNEENQSQHLFGYETDTPSHQFLLNKIFNDETIICTEPETLYTLRLTEAKKYFKEQIKNLEFTEIENLYHKIENRLLFSILDLNEDVDRTIDVSMAFETLNFRGKSLSNLEIFKNRLLFLITRRNYENEDVRKDIKNNIIDTWLIIYKWIGLNKDKELDDDEFLKAFWILNFSDKNMVSEDFKTWINNIFDKDFSLKKDVNLLGYLSVDEIKDWLKLMRDSVELWFIIKNPYFLDENPHTVSQFSDYLTDEIKDYLERIDKFPSRLGNYMQNLILSILCKKTSNNPDENDSNESIEDLLKAIERHNVANFLFNGNKTNLNREHIYRSVNSYYERSWATRKIGENIESVKILSFLSELTKPLDFKMMYANIHFDKRFHSWIGIRYFLYQWEIHLAKLDEKELNYNTIRENWKSVNMLYKTFKEVDKVNKQKRQNRRFGDIDTKNLNTRDKYAFSLGNLFLSKNERTYDSLDDYKNVISVRQRNKDNISYNELELLTYDDWNEDTILERGKKMLDFAIEHWELYKNEILDTKYKEILLDI